MSEELHKPLYSRIQEYIAELILSGKVTPDSKIQSERDFSEDLGVSRMTVRRAITELVNEGLLERKHGSGTYVAKPKLTYEASELANYTEAMQKRNIATTSQLLEFGQVAASKRLGEFLGPRDRRPGLPCVHPAPGKSRSCCVGARFLFRVRAALAWRSGTWRRAPSTTCSRTFTRSRRDASPKPWKQWWPLTRWPSNCGSTTAFRC